MNEMNKKVYLAPQTAMVRVLTEGTFAGSIADDGIDDTITSSAQGYAEIGGTDGFVTGTDDNITWE